MVAIINNAPKASAAADAIVDASAASAPSSTPQRDPKVDAASTGRFAMSDSGTV